MKNNHMLNAIRNELHTMAPPAAEKKAVFFKTGPGDYAEHDQFIGVSTPNLRKIAKHYHNLSPADILELLHSPINEERLLALFILINHYQNGSNADKNKIYQIYRENIQQINNWNLVDASAHLIVGAELHPQPNKAYLTELAISDSLWERRIAIVATWYFIRQDEFIWTIKIAEILLNDSQDLIHKATGWMLRELGKRHEPTLLKFLNQHAHHMPRTMLRYAIERLDRKLRNQYLNAAKTHG